MGDNPFKAIWKRMAEPDRDELLFILRGYLREDDDTEVELLKEFVRWLEEEGE